MQKGKLLDGDDRALSPVVATILLVAIALIVSAVVASGVLGTTDSIEESVQAGATFEVDQEKDNISVGITTLGNADYLVIAGADDMTNSKVVSISPSGGNATSSNWGISYDSEDVLIINKTGNVVINAADGETGIVTIVGVRGNQPADHGDIVKARAIGSDGARSIVAREKVDNL